MSSSGTQISDMTVTVSPLPAESFTPIVVTNIDTGLSPSLNYRYDIGSDLLTRVSYTILLASGGSDLVGFIQAGADAVLRTTQDKARDTVSLLDFGTFSNMAAPLSVVNDNYVLGGKVLVNSHADSGAATNWTLATGVTFNGNRLNLEGDGEQVSVINFTGSGAAITFDNETLGGFSQGSVRNLAFRSANTNTKTGIRLVNVAQFSISNIASTAATWLGTGTTLLRIEGRQYIRIRDSTIYAPRPVFFAVNPEISISGDMCIVENSEVVSSSAIDACITFGDGFSFANTVIEQCDLAGGKQGMFWNDGTSAGSGIQFRVSDVRTEQGLDPTAYALHLETSVHSLQELLVENCRFGEDRNGVYCRNILHGTFVNTSMPQVLPASTVSFNYTIPDGGTLQFINCSLAGTITITNGRQVWKSGTPSAGFSAFYVYDGSTAAGAVQTQAWLGGVPFSLADDAAAVIIAPNTFTGTVQIVNHTDGTIAWFSLNGGDNNTSELLDPSGDYTNTLTTDTKANVGYSSGYKLENKLGATKTFSVLSLGGLAT